MRRSLAILLVIATSCARSSASTGTSPRVAMDPDVISLEELQSPEIAGMDALKAIGHLRPAFFRTSGPQSFFIASAGLLQFSQDFGPLRPVGELASISPSLLLEVRYLNANAAQARFGLNANGGPVIVLLNNKQ